MRGRRGGYRRLAERVRLYEEAQRLERSGQSHGQISKILGVGPSQIRHWLVRGVPPHYDRYDPDLTPSPDLAYLIGFWLGDGRNSGTQKKVRFKLADKEHIQYVNLLVARLLGRDPKAVLMDGPFHVIDYDTSVLYDYIAQPIEMLEPCIEQFKCDFLAGFFDAEGYASCSVNAPSRRLHATVVGVANTNLKYLQLVRRLLAPLGIRSLIVTTNKKGESMTIREKTWVRRQDVHHVVIKRKESVTKFFALIGFRHHAKQEKLRDLVSMLTLSPRQRYEWFVAHYSRRGRRWYKTAS